MDGMARRLHEEHARVMADLSCVQVEELLGFMGVFSLFHGGGAMDGWFFLAWRGEH